MSVTRFVDMVCAVGGCSLPYSIGQSCLDSAKLGCWISKAFVELAGLSVPVAGIGCVAFDLVQHGMDPTGGRVSFTALHDGVCRFPAASEGVIAGLSQFCAGEWHVGFCEGLRPVRTSFRNFEAGRLNFWQSSSLSLLPGQAGCKC